MIVLDTNVVSALMRREPDPVVVAWLDGLPPESVWTTSITVFEVRLGLEILEAGRRRHHLEEAFEKALDEDFENRVLPFDQAAAQAAGRISRKVADLSYEDVARLHGSMRATPYEANRTLSLLSAVLTRAEKWGLRSRLQSVP